MRRRPAACRADRQGRAFFAARLTRILSESEGKKVIAHGGGIDGFSKPPAKR